MVVVQGIVLFMLVLSCHCSHVGAHCNVSGVWVNTLGSVLTISAEGPLLSGFLCSSVEVSVGAAGDKTGTLIGVLGQGNQPTFTMSVRWSGGSVAAWVGQCFQTSRCPVLRTMWLLRSEATVEENNWKATRIGEDIFYPQKTCNENLA
ncbi:avidin-related protein 3-like isoform X2 [Mixophyes fleayi]|uniref:avidin-related protein 3-like isoform X2 n=1 Tax=Mixophyes fleayi TaxID=3061075 RepID=UPI003F4D991A